MNRAAVEEAYGFAFPDDLYAFHAFATEFPEALRTFEIGLDGPFAVLEGRVPAGWTAGADWPRYYLDPVEFFSVMTGHTDGLHWGYWLDDPEELPPVVASYFHSDGLTISVAGQTLFEAFRAQLELFDRDAEDYREDDPDNADDYQQRLDDYAEIRAQMASYWRPEVDGTGRAYLEGWWRRPRGRRLSAPTSDGMGIVVPAGNFRALDGGPPDVPHWTPTPDEVARLVALARADLADDLPGGALQLGRELWRFRATHATSYELLDLAYDALGREALRVHLARAMAFRARCDAEG